MCSHSFKVANQIFETALTKRNIVGFSLAFVVPAKFLLQDLWSKGLDWDDAIGSDIDRRLKKWVDELEVTHSLFVPRCLQDSSTVKSVSVLTFVDAFKDAHRMVCYFRTVDINGLV